ncbi:MAG TPA: hypothetical protein ENG14_05355, partial [Thermodesulforhabdus norvegica]|nr:hypothetical protein [Thermodesulforhabdus norvegica]
RQFPGVRRFQEETLDFYKKHGYIQTATGFKRRGPMKPTEAINTMIQSIAFHTLLQNLIKIQELFDQEGFDSLIVTQTHDSIMFDVVEDEKNEIIRHVTEIMTTPVWDWHKVVPLKVEWEIGRNWYDMQEIKD